MRKQHALNENKAIKDVYLFRVEKISCEYFIIYCHFYWMKFQIFGAKTLSLAVAYHKKDLSASVLSKLIDKLNTPFCNLIKTWIGSLTFDELPMLKFNWINYGATMMSKLQILIDSKDIKWKQSSSLVIDIWLMMLCSLLGGIVKWFWFYIFLVNLSEIQVPFVSRSRHLISAYHISSLIFK